MLTCFMRKCGFPLLALSDLILVFIYASHYVSIDFEMFILMGLALLLNLLEMYAFYFC